MLEKIGAIIRNHRIAKGLTQEELGSKVFVSKQAVSKWETGKTLPDIEMVRELCQILDIDKDEILGGSINETRKNRKLSAVFAGFCAAFLLIALFYVFVGPDYIDRHTQSGVAYVSVFWNGELLTTDAYNVVSELNFEDYRNGYKADVDYGEICGTIRAWDMYDVEFGLINVNNWHNIHIRLDVEKQHDQLTVKQTASYRTDGQVYEVFVNENSTNGNALSVFGGGL